MKAHRITAHLRPESPFYPLFPDGCIPVISPIAGQAILDMNREDVYMASLDHLSEEQIEGIVQILGAGLPISAEEIRNEIYRAGLPIRANSCLCVSFPGGWAL